MSGVAKSVSKVFGGGGGGGPPPPPAAPAGPSAAEKAATNKAAADKKASEAKAASDLVAANDKAAELKQSRTADLKSKVRAAGGVKTENDADALGYQPVAKRKSAARTLLG